MSKKTCIIKTKENELTVTNFNGQRTKWVIGSKAVPKEFFKYFVDCFNESIKKVVDYHDPTKRAGLDVKPIKGKYCNQEGK